MVTINLSLPDDETDVEWPVSWQCDISAASSAATGAAAAAAIDVLRAATGAQFGLIERVIRPCQSKADCYDGTWARFTWSPSLVHCGCDGHSQGCACSETSTVWLADYVWKITDAVVGGESLPSDAYWLESHHRVIRQDGGTWPLCQALDRPEGVDGTWSLHVLTGQPVPTIGQLAAGELACLLLDIVTDPGGCRLPTSWSQISREGVTVTMQDVATLAKLGRIGLDLCDLFIQTYNPEALRHGATVTSADDSRVYYV